MSSRFLIRCSCLALVLVATSHCRKSTPAAATGEPPLAVVAGHVITARDLQAEAEWRLANRQPVPAPAALLKEMVTRHAMVARAKQAGITDENDTRRRVESLWIARLRERELENRLAKIQVDDAELRQAYQQRAAEFNRKGLDRFAILFQAAQAKMTDARRDEARQRLQQGLGLLDANPPSGGRGPAASGFGAVAIDYSEDQAGRYRGGDIGWLETDAQPGRLPAQVLAAGRALAVGARSGILEAEDGYYVIMKTESRAGGQRPFEEVAERLRQSLLREKQRACEEQFVNEALDLAKVEMDSAAAERINLPSNTQPAPAVPAPALPAAAHPAASR